MNKIDNILIEEYSYNLFLKRHTRESIVRKLLSLNTVDNITELFGRSVEINYGVDAYDKRLFFLKDDDCLSNGYTLEKGVYQLKNIVEVLDKETKNDLHSFFNAERAEGQSLIWNSHNILIYTTSDYLSVHSPNGDIRIDCSNPLYNLRLE